MADWDPKILTFYKEVEMLREGRFPRPRMLTLFPSYFCNQDCNGCLFSWMNKKNPKKMISEEILKIISEALDFGIKAINISGGGEPTLVQGLDKAIVFAGSNGMDVRLLTNGKELDKQLITVLISHAKIVRISLDASNKELYRINRRADDFDRVTKNVKALCEEKSRHDSDLIIGIKYLVDKFNKEDLPRAVGFAKSLGVDYVEVKAKRAFGPVLTPVEEVEVEARLEELRKLFPNFVKGSVIKSHLNVPCILTPIHTVVDAYGDVYLCCYFMNRKADHCIGNVFKESLHDFWGSERHREAIERIDRKKCNVFDCRFHKYNNVISEVLGHKDFFPNIV